MLEAGREEKRLAEERGNYYEGVPSRTVIVRARGLISTATMPSLEWQ